MKHYSHDINERLTARHYKSMNFCDVKGKRILDIGCSYGWFEKYALDNGCKEIIAFDLNPSAVSFCKRNFKSKRAKFFVASDSKQFKSNSFDLIVCFEVLEHIPKHCEISLFNEVNRLLKKDGKFILSTPNKHFITNLFDPAWYFGHRHYSKNNLTNFSDSSGLKIKSFYICGGFWELLI